MVRAEYENYVELGIISIYFVCFGRLPLLLRFVSKS